MAIVLVTGSSRGIGFGIAQAFAQNGDTVILNGREDHVQLTKASQELGSVGFCADVSVYAQAKKMITEIEETVGPIEVLVNNAGTAHFSLFSDMAEHEISGVVANNLIGTMNMSHLVVPAMVRAKAGKIINITSIWGLAGASCEVAYSAAKAGVVGFTKALAKELGPSGINVNAIACGAFDTRMNDRLTMEEKSEFTDGIPIGRFGEPREAGSLAVFLANENSSYITGQIIGLDGGAL